MSARGSAPRVALLASGLLLLLLLLLISGLWHFARADALADAVRLRASVAGLSGSPWAAVLVLAVFVVASLALFPISVLIGLTAAVLGPLEAFVWTSLGIVIGASVTYALGLSLRRSRLAQLCGPRLGSINERLGRGGLLAVVLLRTVPLAPFTVVNLLMGASAIGFRDYLLGTLIGMLPGTAAIVLLGDRLARVWQAPTLGNVGLVTLAAAGWVLLALLAHRIVARYDRKRPR